jgi:hypothetical protein
MAFNFPWEICLYLLSFELFICEHRYSIHLSIQLFTGQSLADAGEREVKLVDNWNIKPFA